MPTVVIVQQAILQYRGTFYEELRSRLSAAGVTFRFVESRPVDHESGRGDRIHLVGAQSRPARRVSIAGREALWQPVLGAVRGADLVIVEQGSRLLVNHLLLAFQRMGGPRLAYWGHGRDFDRHGSDVASDRLKAFTSRRVHWWFAYNEATVDIVRALGYPQDRISNVRNATDTARLRGWVRDIGAAERRALLDELGLAGGQVGVYVGAMTSAKRLDHLLDAAEHIRARLPGFELVLAGSGPLSAHVRARVARHDWMAATGPRFGRDLASLFALGRVLLVPAGVGLVVVDGFAAGIPLVASSAFAHRPELAYVTPGRDGLIVDDDGDPAIYAAAVVDLLGDDMRLARLSAGASRAADSLSAQDMATRFADGILQALRAPRYRTHRSGR